MHCEVALRAHCAIQEAQRKEGKMDRERELRINKETGRERGGERGGREGEREGREIWTS